MSGLLRFIGIDLDDIKRRTLWMIGGGIIAAIFVAITFGFLAFAAFLALCETFSPLNAALMVAGGAFVIAVLTFIIAAAFARRTRKDVDAAVRASTVAALSPTIVRLAARHTGIAGAIAVIVATLAYMEGRKR
jgi:hypothetical protein